MSAVARLVTLVDLADDGTDSGQMAVSARLEAVLEDRRRVLLLGDRGWTSALKVVTWESGDHGDGSVDRPDIWATTSVDEIEETARQVVGPDEPVDGGLHGEAEMDYWRHLAGILRQEGVVVDARELGRLPHDVVLAERLLARVRDDRGQGAEGGRFL